MTHITTAVLAATAMALTAGTALANEPAQSGYAPVNGIELYYEIHGTGEPMVLIHGGLGTLDMFTPILPAFTKTRQVVLVDLQGHGHTPPQEREMSYEAWGDDIAALLGWLDFGPTDIVGYSTGADVALRAAIQHPEMVDQLVIVSTAYAFEGWHEYNQQGMKSISAALAEPMKQTPMYQAYVNVAPNVENWPVLLDRFGALSAKEYDWGDDISRLEMPVMLAFGDWDAVSTSHIASFFELLGGGKNDAMWDGSGMNQNRLAILPGRTHYDVFMAPELPGIILPFIDGPAE